MSCECLPFTAWLKRKHMSIKYYSSEAMWHHFCGYAPVGKPVMQHQAKLRAWKLKLNQFLLFYFSCVSYIFLAVCIFYLIDIIDSFCSVSTKAKKNWPYVYRFAQPRHSVERKLWRNLWCDKSMKVTELAQERTYNYITWHSSALNA